MEMDAVITTGDGKTALARVPVPKAQSGQVLIRVVAAAQNPSECKLHLLSLITSTSIHIWKQGWLLL